MMMKTHCSVFLIALLSVLKTCSKSCENRVTNNVSIAGANRKSSIDWFETSSIADFTVKQSAAHLQSLVAKVRAGRPLIMVALGGSNSAGGGLRKADQKYFNIVADLWNKRIYKSTGSSVTPYNMAIGGCGSDFFSMCFQNYLPKQPTDIVLVEQAVNDNGNIYGKASQPMELLTRRLLMLPSKPLVMYVHLVYPNIINGTICNDRCTNMQDWGFDELAKHYGIPSVSMKDIVCPLTSDGKRKITIAKRHMFADDGLHAGYRSHAKLATMIMEYFEKIIAENPCPENSKDLPPLKTPLFCDPSISDAQLADVMCWSHLTPNWTRPLLRQTLNASVTLSRGFRYLSPEQALTKSRSRLWYTDSHGGWNVTSEKAEKKLLKIRFTCPNISNITSGTVNSSLRSVLVILKNHHFSTSFRLSIDDDPKSCIDVVYKTAKKPWSSINLYPIATEISPGNHTLKIESMYGPLRVSGLVIGYHGFHAYEGYKVINETITNCYNNRSGVVT